MARSARMVLSNTVARSLVLILSFRLARSSKVAHFSALVLFSAVARSSAMVLFLRMARFSLLVHFPRLAKTHVAPFLTPLPTPAQGPRLELVHNEHAHHTPSYMGVVPASCLEPRTKPHVDG